jgi:hypothetical protein
MYLRMQCIPPAWISSAGIWSEPGAWYLFIFLIATSTSAALGCGTNGSAVSISVCLIPPGPCSFNNWQVLPPSQTFLTMRKKIALLILYQISFRLVTLLKFSYAPIQVSDVLILTVYCLLLLFTVSISLILSFKYSLFLFLKCLLASLLTLRKLSSFTTLGSCTHCNLACFLRSTNFKHSSLNRGLQYAIGNLLI